LSSSQFSILLLNFADGKIRQKSLGHKKHSPIQTNLRGKTGGIDKCKGKESFRLGVMKAVRKKPFY
jgi:hypothetical protein